MACCAVAVTRKSQDRKVGTSSDEFAAEMRAGGEEKSLSIARRLTN